MRTFIIILLAVTAVLSVIAAWVFYDSGDRWRSHPAVVLREVKREDVSSDKLTEFVYRYGYVPYDHAGNSSKMLSSFGKKSVSDQQVLSYKYFAKRNSFSPYGPRYQMNIRYQNGKIYDADFSHWEMVYYTSFR